MKHSDYYRLIDRGFHGLVEHCDDLIIASVDQLTDMVQTEIRRLWMSNY